MALVISPTRPIDEKIRTLLEGRLPDTHPMRVIGDHLSDFVCDEDFADLYCPTQGQEAISPTIVAMVTLFQAWEDLTDRQAAEMVVTRLDWKYALHLPLDHLGFAHSALHEFRERLKARGAEERLFDLLLGKLRALGLLKGRRQRSDTFAVLSAVRRLNRLELVWETLRLALCALEEADLVWLQEQVPLSWADRYGERGVQDRLVKEKGEEGGRQARVLAKQVGQDGLLLLSKMEQGQTPQVLRTLPEVQVLREVWAQQYVVREGLVEWPQQSQSKGAETICTPHDREVRYATKRDFEWEGYKVAVTETFDEGAPHLTTHVETMPATQTEFGLAGEIEADLDGKGLLPDEHLVDMGFVNGEALAASAARGVDLVGPARPDSSAQARMEGGLTADQFEVDREKKQARCPAGQISVEWRERKEEGRKVTHAHFDPTVCSCCAHYKQCVATDKDEPRGRSLTLREHHEIVQARRREQKTEAFQRRYRPRAGIEGTLSEMGRAHGLRQARHRGLAGVHLRDMMVAAATNLKRAARWLADVALEGTRGPCLRRLAAAAAG